MKIVAFLIPFTLLFSCTDSTVSEPESLALQSTNKQVFDAAITRISGDKLTDFKLNKEAYTWKDLDLHYLKLDENYNDLALDLIKVKTISSIFNDFNLLDYAKSDKQALQKCLFYLDEFTKLKGVQSDLVVKIINKLGDDLSNKKKTEYIKRTIIHNEIMIKSFADGLSIVDLKAKSARMTDQEINKIKKFPIARIKELEVDNASLKALLY